MQTLQIIVSERQQEFIVFKMENDNNTPINRVADVPSNVPHPTGPVVANMADFTVAETARCNKWIAETMTARVIEEERMNPGCKVSESSKNDLFNDLRSFVFGTVNLQNEIYHFVVKYGTSGIKMKEVVNMLIAKQEYDRPRLSAQEMLALIDDVISAIFALSLRGRLQKRDVPNEPHGTFAGMMEKVLVIIK